MFDQPMTPKLALVYFVLPMALAYGLQNVGNKTGLIPASIDEFTVTGSPKAAGPADQNLDNPAPGEPEAAPAK